MFSKRRQSLVATLGQGDLASFGAKNRVQEPAVRLAVVNYEKFSIL
jgi:hypothetical protein